MQMFVRFEKGMERLRKLSEREVSFLDDYVLCTRCSVAVKRIPKTVQKRIFGKAGWYCPECEKLLVEVPPG